VGRGRQVQTTRLSRRLTLSPSPFTRDDTSAYLAVRLQRAGRDVSSLPPGYRNPVPRGHRRGSPPARRHCRHRPPSRRSREARSSSRPRRHRLRNTVREGSSGGRPRDAHHADATIRIARVMPTTQAARPPPSRWRHDSQTFIEWAGKIIPHSFWANALYAGNAGCGACRASPPSAPSSTEPPEAKAVIHGTRGSGPVEQDGDPVSAAGGHDRGLEFGTGGLGPVAAR
jgi:hypothetical protein